MREWLGLGEFIFLSILLQLVAFLCDGPCPRGKKGGGGYLMYGNDGVCQHNSITFHFLALNSFAFPTACLGQSHMYP